ncbi:MAG TPA: dipeptide epimerase [Bacteroidota bacterium]|nr:dipeptide epimerase [Bacteroidota bacterium]
MKNSRRSFLQTAAAAAGVTLIPTDTYSTLVNATPRALRDDRMKFTFRPYTIELKHPFTISVLSRTTTPVMLTEVEYSGIVGYGEASMPPYLGESHETATAFLSKVDLSKYENPFELETILSDIDALAPGNPAAKASVDIALHDLIGKILNKPWYDIWGFDKKKAPNTTFTIGIDKPDVVRQKVKEAVGFKILKVKLGRDNDKEMIETIRSLTDVPLTVDPNQGWKDKNYALDMAHWLKDRNVKYIEQPLPKEMVDDIAWLTERSPLPILADEGFQRLSDLRKIPGTYNGIVVKLMKSTGLREAHTMVMLARALDLKIMLGCMVETSCAVTAASHLSPMVNWADLDGNLLITNDVFDGMKVIDGKVTIPDRPGIGVIKL